jgi:chitosanase
MDKRSLIKKVLLAFEQSSTEIKYEKIYLYDDGPNDAKQITLSFGITEYGNLKDFIKSYIFAGGKHAKFFTDYADKIGKVSLVKDNIFIHKLKEAGSDPVMQECQEKAFDRMYIEPAYKFCEKNKLVTNLSRLVISDSYLHSGSVLKILRNRFAESVPANGGDEYKWTELYCKARKDWLENHSRKILNKTVYRMNFMLDRIKKGDWELTQSPFDANGVKITL